ncbi:hypothetical protein SYNPS1DRAFT_25439 [Syncephalis pseudoplumigaleata]|uniref:Cofilin n=1 Tax=Syncephalis pseudoplumigaleata TaxID=1712513 RepID=A0A4P9YS21_9FUNG|nr:hypothetical protein SYNPS1DRAFT_25439 [Syncephalis pseudoplumigaleata]|eukprot:RKP22713.1 hypothetical protein SYNPS1DRAFT_25439 [Syncephalis pseudoplumigaleata]
MVAMVAMVAMIHPPTEVATYKNASTGVEPSDECIKAFQDLKQHRKYKYIFFRVDEPSVAAGKREKILLISWVPDTLGIKTKMLYAGSKNALLTKLGNPKEVQANDPSDIQDESVLTKA